ncbi:MAG: DnaD domain protein [Clostridia bacterium]|nr:DnaD domain protein [Clostridia bacterium]
MTCSYSKEFSNSAFTDVENVFITEYLPVSSGDAVKVYLYGLYLCQNPKLDQPLSEIAKTLSMTENAVIDCFEYWEEFGLLCVLTKEPLTVQYQPIRCYGGGKPKKIKAEKYTDFTKSLQAILPERMISTSEYSEYFSIMETYSIKPEAMLMIVKYCAERKGADIGYRYVSKVAKDFGNRGITTVDKVEKELSSHILRTSIIERILKAMGLRRQPELEDSTLLKKWTLELGFEEENVIFAASKLKKGSMAKLDKFLIDLYSMKSFSKEEIADYMDRKKEVYDLAVKINKSLSIYVEVLDPVVDTYTKKWLSYGFTESTLLFIANHCFKTGKKTLQDMDELLEYLRARGFIDLSSVNDYFEQIKKSDEFLSKMLLTAGVNRRPTAWDRENLAMWKSWNFSEDMIIEAASLSAGKNSPTAYMNGILSNWKNNGVFTPSAVPEKVGVATNSQELYNREYERRRTLAVARAQKNLEQAMQLDGFTDAYGRLNGIEKDLAFAEFNNNQVAIEQLESEKTAILNTVKNMLSPLSLTIEDLSPRYACDKCNDTGYVGTHRCDCFDKEVK